MILAFNSVFIVCRTVSLHFGTTIQAQRNRSESFKIMSVYIHIKTTSSDRQYLRQIATATLELGLLRQLQKAKKLCVITVRKPITWIYPLLLYRNSRNGYQFAAKYMQFSP